MKCSVCQNGQLRQISEEQKLMPPPIGTNWAPAIYYQRKYQCDLCGSTYTQKNNEKLIFQESYLEEIIWEYLAEGTVSSQQKLMMIGSVGIPTLIDVVKRALKNSGRKTNMTVEAAMKALLVPCKRLLSVLDYRSRRRLCDAIGSADHQSRKVAALLLNTIDPPDENLSAEVRYWLENVKFDDKITMLLLYLYLDETRGFYGDNQAHEKLERLAREFGLENPGLFGKIMTRATAELMGRV